MKNNVNVYRAREIGKNYCQTDGSKHYRNNEETTEPMDLIIAQGFAEDFCIANMIKYATRFKRTRNLEDLKKVADYAHILSGIEIYKRDIVDTGIADCSIDTARIGTLNGCNIAAGQLHTGKLIIDGETIPAYFAKALEYKNTGGGETNAKKIHGTIESKGSGE